MTQAFRAALAGLSLAALVLASCSTQRPAPPRPSPQASPPPVPVASRIPSAASYVATAGSIDLYVSRATDLVLQRSSDPALRALARELGAEHRGLAAQLSFAGRRVNALPSPRMFPREEQRYALLSTQRPLDETFLRQMVVTHEQALALHGVYAVRGTSPTLRAVAVNGARVERAHLAALGGL